MAHRLAGSYAWGHETPSNSRSIGTAAAPSHRPVATRQGGSRDCADGGRGAEVSVALGAALPGEGDSGLTRSARSGTALLSFRRAENSSDPSLSGWRTGPGLPDRIVDVGAYRPGSLARVSHSLPSQCLVVPLAGAGLELSEARAARLSAHRRRHCALETVRVAAYKKRPPASGRTWFSWTKVASCSSPTLNGPGPHEDKPRSAPCGTNKGASMPSMPWPCPPSASAWRSTSSSIGVPCGEKKWSSSSTSC